MNVTSMLSNGYLQPFHRPEALFERPEGAREAPAPRSLVAQERNVLAQERNIKMTAGPSAEVTAVYHYTIGPDGKRYISGASLTVKGDESAVNRVAGGVSVKGEKAANASEGTKAKATQGSNPAVQGGRASSPQEEAAIRELQQIEREVIAHEAAHQAAAGRFGGPVRYTRTQGPDGRSYITGGSVPIRIPASDDPEETLRNMEQIQRAAMAPGDPSGQDLQVAAKAAAAAIKARQELASAKSEKNLGQTDPAKTGVSSVRASLRFERLISTDDAEGVHARRAPNRAAVEDAYARSRTSPLPHPLAPAV